MITICFIFVDGINIYLTILVHYYGNTAAPQYFRATVGSPLTSRHVRPRSRHYVLSDIVCCMQHQLWSSL